MDSYKIIDNIQVEKANALARYKRLNNITKVFRVMEFLVLVALISWSTSYVPNGFKVVGGYIYACSCYILNQHVVFLLGNFIVVLCYVLSGQTENATESVAELIDSATDSVVIQNVTESVVPQGFEDNYKTYETNETVLEVVPAQLPVVDNSPQMKETVLAEKTEGKIVENEEMVVKTESELVAEEAIKQATKQIERFKRTQSARLKREMSMRPCRELRRSVTDRRRGGRDLDTDRRKSDGDSTVDRLSNEELRLSVADRLRSGRDLDTDRRKSDGDSTVDSLSNEEFQRTIEEFISKQKIFIKQQPMVEQSY
ncbi:hypothetical protein CTI12_AA206210 [Artemisia annua]|uniref:Uncharacterized protein n=1 Tax=Artemisia annua TaxID=35608 RepID=A0A2U1P112_ARTAN|nr:hypothetical protein CTI12_AA206210 [Artemisia annua]